MKKATVISFIIILMLAAAVVFGIWAFKPDQAAQKAEESLVEPDRPGPSVSYPQTIQEYTVYVRDRLMGHAGEMFEKAGYEPGELTGYSIGNAFSIYVFDKDGKLLPHETVTACPIELKNVYKGKIVVTLHECNIQMEIQKDALLSDLSGGTVDTEKVLTLGRIGSKVFVTDGVNLDIIERGESAPDELTDEQIKAMAGTFKAAAGEEYSYLCGYFVSVNGVR